jgi:hypothetical protein
MMYPLVDCAALISRRTHKITCNPATTMHAACHNEAAHHCYECQMHLLLHKGQFLQHQGQQALTAYTPIPQLDALQLRQPAGRVQQKVAAAAAASLNYAGITCD